MLPFVWNSVAKKLLHSYMYTFHILSGRGTFIYFRWCMWVLKQYFIPCLYGTFRWVSKAKQTSHTPTGAPSCKSQPVERRFILSGNIYRASIHIYKIFTLFRESKHKKIRFGPDSATFQWCMWVLKQYHLDSNKYSFDSSWKLQWQKCQSAREVTKPFFLVWFQYNKKLGSKRPTKNKKMLRNKLSPIIWIWIWTPPHCFFFFIIHFFWIKAS